MGKNNQPRTEPPSQQRLQNGLVDILVPSQHRGLRGLFFLTANVVHWSGGVHYRHDCRGKKMNGAGTLLICFCYSFLLAEPLDTRELHSGSLYNQDMIRASGLDFVKLFAQMFRLRPRAAYPSSAARFGYFLRCHPTGAFLCTVKHILRVMHTQSRGLTAAQNAFW